MKRLIPLAIVLLGGMVLWNTGAFGLFPTLRSVTWRFPVSYAEVRAVDLQIWDGENLITREEKRWPDGLTEEPTMKIPLARGSHRAIARLELANQEVRTFQRALEAGADETLVIEMAK